jgi:hypothetical protein
LFAVFPPKSDFFNTLLGFVEVSAEEHKSVLLHARDIVAEVPAAR